MTRNLLIAFHLIFGFALLPGISHAGTPIEQKPSPMPQTIVQNEAPCHPGAPGKNGKAGKNSHGGLGGKGGAAGGCHPVTH